MKETSLGSITMSIERRRFLMVASHPRSQKPSSWIIRKPDGRKYDCKDRETLHRWIAEDRVQRDDELSDGGENWFRLGDSPQLVRMFDARGTTNGHQRNWPKAGTALHAPASLEA